jgi:hypothetical protein
MFFRGARIGALGQVKVPAHDFTRAGDANVFGIHWNSNTILCLLAAIDRYIANAIYSHRIIRTLASCIGHEGIPCCIIFHSKWCYMQWKRLLSCRPMINHKQRRTGMILINLHVLFVCILLDLWPCTRLPIRLHEQDIHVIWGLGIRYGIRMERRIGRLEGLGDKCKRWIGGWGGMSKWEQVVVTHIFIPIPSLNWTDEASVAE